VQVLFGFLLALPFSSRFGQLGSSLRGLYVADLVVAATATALLLAPVAYHRLVFRRRQKERLVEWANRMAICGLVAVAVAISGAVCLVVSDVAPGVSAALVTALSVGMFGGLWFAMPLTALRRARREPVGAPDAGRDSPPRQDRAGP
jgi:hypothetical protein